MENKIPQVDDSEKPVDEIQECVDAYLGGALTRPSRESFAWNLDRLMEARNVKAVQLAEAIGVTQSTISKIRSGLQTQISFEIQDRIAKYFNVPLADLYLDPTDGRAGGGVDLETAYRMIGEALKGIRRDDN